MRVPVEARLAPCDHGPVLPRPALTRAAYGLPRDAEADVGILAGVHSDPVAAP